jgi:hypothetical protein
MAQRQIIILRRTDASNGNPVFGYVLRADVPAARRPFLVDPTYVSPFKPVPPDTDPDLPNLTNGAIVEKLDAISVDKDMTIADVQAVLIRLQQQFQADVTADKTFARYGSSYDGSIWTPRGA